jgi:SecD/SecF fusion protein
MDGSKMTGRYKKMKKGKSWVIILVAVICIGLLGWYSTTVITDTKQKQEATANGESTKDKDYQNIKLGLDLSGGVSITYHIKDKNPSDKDVNDTIAKLEERAESYTTEYSVYKSGDDRITVEIPGVEDPNKVLEDLGSSSPSMTVTEMPTIHRTHRLRAATSSTMILTP